MSLFALKERLFEWLEDLMEPETERRHDGSRFDTRRGQARQDDRDRTDRGRRQERRDPEDGFDF